MRQIKNNKYKLMKKNNLYPIFLKMSQLQTLIVGGGNVALEKLTFLLKSSPDAKVTMVAPFFKDETKKLADRFDVKCIAIAYDEAFLCDKDLIIAATNKTEINKRIYNDAKRRNLLINVADTPELCDFYLGGIVTKGNIKIAISTNGKSPTMAKRLRQFFEAVIPDEIDDLALNLNRYRKGIKGDFASKVTQLNKLTQSLVK